MWQYAEALFTAYYNKYRYFHINIFRWNIFSIIIIVFLLDFVSSLKWMKLIKMKHKMWESCRAKTKHAKLDLSKDSREKKERMNEIRLANFQAKFKILKSHDRRHQKQKKNHRKRESILKINTNGIVSSHLIFFLIFYSFDNLYFCVCYRTVCIASRCADSNECSFSLWIFYMR